MPGCKVPALAAGVNAGVLLSVLVVCLSWMFSLSLLATVRGSTRHFFVQSDKETKQRKRFQNEGS
jgi:hypothetical protein